MTTTLLEALERVREALDELARALASGDASAVLAAEEPVGSAVAALSAAKPATGNDKPGLSPAIHSVRAAMTRCEALGRTADDFLRAVFPQPAYGRRGLQLVSSRPRRLTSIR
jgi:hypothetical protein